MPKKKNDSKEALEARKAELRANPNAILGRFQEDHNIIGMFLCGMLGESINNSRYHLPPIIFIGNNNDLSDAVECTYHMWNSEKLPRIRLDCTERSAKEIKAEFDAEKNKHEPFAYKFVELRNVQPGINPFLEILSEEYIVATTTNAESLSNIYPSFLRKCVIFDLNTNKKLKVSDLPAPTPKVETEEPRAQSETPVKTGKKQSKPKKQAIDNFEDVEIEMIVDFKGNYQASDYKIIVKCNNPLIQEFKLEHRFKGVLYLLVRGAKHEEFPVKNAQLRKAHNDINDAKKEIVIAFKAVIGPRAKDIIHIAQGIGKQLMIPKKNIQLKEYKSPFA